MTNEGPNWLGKRKDYQIKHADRIQFARLGGVISALRKRVAVLEAENARLRSRLESVGVILAPSLPVH